MMAMNKWRKKKDAIGSGSHADVHLAVPVDGGDNSSMIAVKSRRLSFAFNLLEEAKVLKQLRGCSHVVQCFGTDVSDNGYGDKDYNLLLEYAPAGSLGRMIRPGRRWDDETVESDVKFYTFQILKGLLEIHNRGFVHADLKPDNILVFPTTPEGKLLLKLADFGVSTRAGEKDKPYYCNEGDNDNEDDDDDEPFDPLYYRGSLVYVSPEYLNTGIHESLDDIWALGCTVIEMFTGYPPWLCQSSNDLIFQIQNDKPTIPEDISNMANDFLTKCFYRKDYGDDERWTAKMLLSHPFVQNNEDAVVLLERVPSRPNNPLSYDGDDQWVSTKDMLLI